MIWLELFCLWQQAGAALGSSSPVESLHPSRLSNTGVGSCDMGGLACDKWLLLNQNNEETLKQTRVWRTFMLLCSLTRQQMPDTPSKLLLMDELVLWHSCLTVWTWSTPMCHCPLSKLVLLSHRLQLFRFCDFETRLNGWKAEERPAP